MENSATCTALKGKGHTSLLSLVVMLKIQCVERFAGLLTPVGGLALAEMGDVYLPFNTTALSKKLT